MRIERYELGRIVRMTSRGPLWQTTSDRGPALIALRGREEGDASCARWRAWARIDSPHVAALHDVVRHDDGRWAVVQEYVEGDGLDVLLGGPRIRPLEIRRRLGEGIREGVEALHRAGLVHGDLSPANIVVDSSCRAVLVDLIDPPAPESGTPGWSLGTGEGKHGDLGALALILAALGLDSPREPGARAQTATAPAATGQDPPQSSDARDADPPLSPSTVDEEAARSLLEPMLLDPERAVIDLRRAAAATPTTVPSRRPRKTDSRPDRTPIRRIAVGCAAAGMIAVLAWGGQVLGRLEPAASGSVGARGRAVATAPLESTSPRTRGSPIECPGARMAQERIDQILRIRDRAIEEAEPAALGRVVSGALGQEEGARIDSLVARGLRIDRLTTTPMSVDVIGCSPAGLDVLVVIRQDELRWCDATSCREEDVGQARRLRILLVDPGLTADRARPDSVTAPGSGADASRGARPWARPA
ncbi:hypothetical protein M3T53_06565 [Actinomyces sp. B33]|uniref:protein kinase domain-containing protein n=1 Tax=Actinomyces sp. B33 TaxID=2942131 RepID=UPI0023401BA8|nr:RIO1 family regulatory kinase/ATPase [Actinomyces sp. B33]MDC4233372.1 hypothetical protein [Actinomyces sp. B33]